MSKVNITLDEDNAKTFSNVLERIIDGEDIMDDSSDLLWLIEQYKELLDDEIRKIDDDF